MLWKYLVTTLFFTLSLNWLYVKNTYGQASFYLAKDSILVLISDSTHQLEIQNFDGIIETKPIIYSYSDFSVKHYVADICFVNQTGHLIIYDDKPTIWNDCSFRCYPNKMLAQGDSAWIKLHLYPYGKLHSSSAKKYAIFKRKGSFKFLSPGLGDNNIPVHFWIRLSPLDE